MSSELLKSLGLDAINAGTYLGNGEWSSATSGELITPVNPTTGEPIAQVRATTEAEYETVVARAQEAFKVWRTTPARAAVRPCACAAKRCASTRMRWVRWSPWKWARASRKATAKCRR